MDIVSKLHEYENEYFELKSKPVLSGIERKRLEFLQKWFSPKKGECHEEICEACGS